MTRPEPDVLISRLLIPVFAAAIVLPAIGAASAALPAAALRCGWLENPTPANWWLRDRAGGWMIGTQGGPRAAGIEDMPDMTTMGWVATNGDYGHGCACITGIFDAKAHRVVRMIKAEPKPLKSCRADRRLPKPEE